MKRNVQGSPPQSVIQGSYINFWFGNSAGQGARTRIPSILAPSHSQVGSGPQNRESFAPPAPRRIWRAPAAKVSHRSPEQTLKRSCSTSGCFSARSWTSLGSFSGHTASITAIQRRLVQALRRKARWLPIVV